MINVCVFNTTLNAAEQWKSNVTINKSLWNFGCQILFLIGLLVSILVDLQALQGNKTSVCATVLCLRFTLFYVAYQWSVMCRIAAISSFLKYKPLFFLFRCPWGSGPQGVATQSCRDCQSWQQNSPKQTGKRRGLAFAVGIQEPFVGFSVVFPSISWQQDICVLF